MFTHGNDNISNFKWKILTTECLKSTRLAKKYYKLKVIIILCMDVKVRNYQHS